MEASAVLVSLLRGDRGAANTTTALLLLGEHLEAGIRRRSDALLLALLRPLDDHVDLLVDGHQQRCPLEALRGGESVVVEHGSVIPVDGTVLSGEASVDEAAMTGESLPVTRRRGDRVMSGTAVLEGRLIIYAERVGAQTAASRIGALVETALTSKGEVQLQASALADRLVPAVFGLALLTQLASGDWTRTAAVLQADYCCALKLAIPVAFKAAMARAGRRGCLIKGAAALERLAAVDTVVFDKTGTLTTGRLAVTDSLSFDGGTSADDLLSLAASIEEHSVHPLALAVVEAACGRGYHHFRHSEVEFIVAHGVAATIQGERVVVGSRHFVVEDEGVDDTPHRAAIEALWRQGKSLLYIGRGRRLIGVLALEDQVRAGSAATVARLRSLGVKEVLMLSGDQRDVAERIAAHCGLDRSLAELLPEQKAEIVRALCRDGRTVLFVGDGINDAPALAAADVGLAMQRGADIAQLSADITLLEDDIGCVAEAMELAGCAMGRVQRNAEATVVVNTGLLISAALGGLTPVQASLLHNGSTLLVLLSALLAGSATSETGPATGQQPH
nr:heavy metal translocating P-type ATPase [Synechococcus sp. RSCCF101]